MSGSRRAAADEAITAAIAAMGLDHPQIDELAGGIANRSFRLRDRTQDLVLRLAGTSTPGLGASRASELAMQRVASGAGLAPEIVLADRDHDFIVTRHVDGRMPNRYEMRDARFLARFGTWIARLHALEPPAGLPVVDFGERAAGYLSLLGPGNRGAEIAKIARGLDRRRAVLTPPLRLAACHHDLHHRNFVDAGDRLLAVDWEYAGPGDPAADLACCIGYHDLDAACVGSLLEAYGSDTPALRARIEALGWIFDCLWYGWNAAAEIAGLEVDPGQQGRLAARLAG